ncbi:hypothetical protein D3C85_1878200 [compost metagenome]
MSIDEEFEAWLQEQASHGVCMGGYTFEEALIARAAWHAAKGSTLTASEIMDKHLSWCGE